MKLMLVEICTALDAGGFEFIAENADDPGVRLAKASPPD